MTGCMMIILVVELSRAGLSRRMTRISEARKDRELISLMAAIGCTDAPADPKRRCAQIAVRVASGAA